METASKNSGNNPKVSVITVVLNNKKFIEQAILSVLNQTYRNIEYIIIDGGSVDGTLDIIDKYKNRLTRFVSEKDKGIYDAMNKGIALAKGEWLHILNSDDYYASNDVLEKASKFLRQPARYFYYFTLLLQDSQGRLKAQKFRHPQLNFWKLFYSAYLPHPSLFVHKSHYQKIGLFDTNFKIAADHDLILRLCKKFKPLFCDLSLTVMRGGGASASDWLTTVQEFKQVAIKNGLPRFLAQLFFRFKALKHNFAKNYGKK